MKYVGFRIVALGIGFLAIWFSLEIVLTFLPVHGSTQRLPVTQEEPILRFQPNRVFDYSRGWNFKGSNTIKVNNAGFVSNVDYEPRKDNQELQPVIAVIGDSYVEAFHVPHEETCGGRLGLYLKDKARVYTFGVSGSPLSQYLAYAKYVAETYQPHKMIVVIVGNDFDESLLRYKKLPGYYYFKEDGQGNLGLELVEYEPELLKKVVRTSSLARYLFINLQLTEFPNRLKGAVWGEPKKLSYVGNTSADVDSERIYWSRKAVDLFLTLLPDYANLTPSEILLVIDGIRPQLYEREGGRKSTASYFEIMRNEMIGKADENGFKVLDMENAFTNHFRKNQKRFEFEDDSHWNSLGNKVCFQNVLTTSITEDL